MHYWLWVYWLIKVMVVCSDIYVLVCVCVNGSALVLCGHEMWFVGGRSMCAYGFGVLVRWSRYWYRIIGCHVVSMV
jgi:hypothetical protein